MQLGEVLTRFDDEVLAAETLRTLDDRSLTAKVSDAAAEEDLTPGEFAVRSVDQFITHASDADWHAMIGLTSHAKDPGQMFLCRVLSDALAHRA